MATNIKFPENLSEDRYFELSILDTKTLENNSNAFLAEIDKIYTDFNKLMDENKSLDLPGAVDASKAESLYIIDLPLPNEITENYTHIWQEQEGIAKTTIDSTTGLLGTLKGEKVKGKNTIKGSILNAVAGVAKKGPQTKSQVANLLGQRNIQTDPGFYQHFTGTKPREFTFTFDLVPNSSEDSTKIVEILRLIKQYSSPNSYGQTVMIAPNRFKFKFSNKNLQNIINPLPVIVTNVSTNYAPTGAFEAMAKGMPKIINLSITMTEIRMLERNDWGKPKA